VRFAPASVLESRSADIGVTTQLREAALAGFT
jgi:hypothetical protein